MNNAALLELIGRDREYSKRLLIGAPADCTHISFLSAEYAKWMPEEKISRFKKPHIWSVLESEWKSVDARIIFFDRTVLVRFTEYMFLYQKLFFSDSVPQEEIVHLIHKIPSGAEAYNFLSKKFYRRNPLNHEKAEVFLNREWVDSYYGAAEMDELFIDVRILQDLVPKNKHHQKLSI